VCRPRVPEQVSYACLARTASLGVICGRSGSRTRFLSASFLKLRASSFFSPRQAGLFVESLPTNVNNGLESIPRFIPLGIEVSMRMAAAFLTGFVVCGFLGYWLGRNSAALVRRLRRDRSRI
jgi:hypothetical protein